MIYWRITSLVASPPGEAVPVLGLLDVSGLGEGEGVGPEVEEGQDGVVN